MPDRHGPLLGNHFQVEWEGTRIGFSRVVLPGATALPVSYRDGSNLERSPTQLIGKTENDLLILERGVLPDDTELYDWFATASSGDLDNARRSVTVSILDEKHEPAVTWTFKNAWPAHYQPPTLDATGNEVAIERIEIAHEGMERT